MKTRIMSGIDTMTQASQSIFEWCDSVKPLFTTPAADEPTQDSPLLKVLDDGIEKMSSARSGLQNSSQIFNEATGKLISLQHRFEKELQEKSKHLQTKTSYKIITDFKEKLTSTEKFYKNLKAKSSQTSRDIGELMTQAIAVKRMKYSDQSIKNLVAKCNEYNKNM